MPTSAARRILFWHWFFFRFSIATCAGCTRSILTLHMSRWVVKVDRVIHHIRIPIPRLRVAWAWNEAIWLEETSKHGGIESGMVVHQSTHTYIQGALSRIGEVGGRLGIGAWYVGPLAAEG